MNRFSTIVVMGLFLSATNVRAEALDGYLGFSGGLTKHMTMTDQLAGKNSRIGARLDFVRLEKNIAIDFRFGKGLTYKDFGGAFKLFHHFVFSSATATGVSVGSGIGAMYSSGVEGANAAFTEIFAPVFGRVIFDFGIGAGLFVDMEYQARFSRQGSSSVTSGTGLANRYYVGAGVAINAM